MQNQIKIDYGKEHTNINLLEKDGGGENEGWEDQQQNREFNPEAPLQKRSC